MGNLFSLFYKPATLPAQPAEPVYSQPEEHTQQKKPAQKKKIDRSIFEQKDKQNETIERVHGQINGNQFTCDRLDNCKVYVHDFCDSMTIDNCNDSVFILSAVRGSIFIRNCNNCKFVMVCGQFRCRDCIDCDFFMQVKTGPVVESSTNSRIGCATISYPELLEDMAAAKLIPTRNEWTDVHDFTPSQGNYYLTDERLVIEGIGNTSDTMLPITVVRKEEVQVSEVTIGKDKFSELVNVSKQTRIVSIEEDGETLKYSVESAN